MFTAADRGGGGEGGEEEWSPAEQPWVLHTHQTSQTRTDLDKMAEGPTVELVRLAVPTKRFPASPTQVPKVKLPLIISFIHKTKTSI